MTGNTQKDSRVPLEGLVSTCRKCGVSPDITIKYNSGIDGKRKIPIYSLHCIHCSIGTSGFWYESEAIQAWNAYQSANAI